MSLSKESVLALMLDIHQSIEENAEQTVINVIGNNEFDPMRYPPNGGLTELEKEELKKLDNNVNLKSALRKIFASNASNVVFEFLNLIDGTTDPKNTSKDWNGVKLKDMPEEYDESEDEGYSPMLHDEFYETYWLWRKIRTNREWKLDNYEG